MEGRDIINGGTVQYAMKQPQHNTVLVCLHKEIKKKSDAFNNNRTYSVVYTSYLQNVGNP